MSRFFQNAFGSHQNFSNTVIASFNGTGIIVNMGNTHTLPEAKYFKLVALDENKKELDSFSIPADGRPTISVKAKRINKIESSSCDIQVTKCGDIDKMSSMSGDITVESCGDARSVSSMSGDVTINSATGVDEASSMSGKVIKRKSVVAKTSSAKRCKPSSDD